jgi:hypothetical protein
MYCVETSGIILEKALEILKNSSVNEELNALLQKLESKTIENILNLEKNTEIRIIHNDIRTLCVPIVKIKPEIITELIFTEQIYLKRGIENVDLKLILIFLCVNCYLQIDIKKLLTDQELSEYSTRLISNRITEFLQRISLDIKMLPDASYYEIEMMKDFHQGIRENDIKKTYQFIEAIERGGCGFHFNFLLEDLISFLYELNYSYFLNHISKISNLQSIIFYIQSFDIEQLFCLSKEPLLTNKWLNFELSRQIIEKERKDGFEETECIAIENILMKINADDFDFLKQTIQYFHRSKLFNAALGKLLISFTDCKIQEILSDCFIINAYNNNCEARKKMLERIENNASELKLRICLSIIYEKWKSYLDELFNSDDFYQNDILLTDFCDFIVLYYIQITHEEDIINQISEIIKQLIWIELQWFASKSKLLTTFSLLCSKLYLLSFAYREKQLKNKHIATLFSNMKCDNILLKRYFRDNESLRIIEENLAH